MSIPVHDGLAYLIALDPCFSNREFKIGKKGVTLGRDPSKCDITASKRIISRLHARICYEEERNLFYLYDLNSTNGTYLNGKRISEAFLKEGDIIGLGSGQMMHLRFQLTSSRNFSLELKLPPKKIWTIGRLPDNDISLPFEPTVSAYHARIFNINGKLLLKDNQSLNGTWLNGRKVKSAELDPADTVVVGSTYFHFSLNHDGSLRVLRRETGDDIKLDCVYLSRQVATSSKIPKFILKDITLSLQPGEFVGILGPSGSGKTTLLKALNGYKCPDTGEVLYNEVPLYKAYDMFRNSIGYVPQDDIIHLDLNVRKCLDYVARLRLPPDMGKEDRRDIIESIIETLGLANVSENRVRDLSGGQRKRVSIGAELITRPSILFLDEPTAGLDPYVEEKLMMHFKKMAEKGTTILITTHILYSLSLLDRIIILSCGRLVFFGTPSEAIKFFSTKNYTIKKPTQIFELLEGKATEILTDIPLHSDDIKLSIADYYETNYIQSSFWKTNIKHNFSPLAKDLFEHFKHQKKDKNINKKLSDLPKIIKQILLNNSWNLRFGDLISLRSWIILSQRHMELRLASWKRAMIYMFIPLVLALVTLSQPIKRFPEDAIVDKQHQQIEKQIQRGGPLLEYHLKTLFSPKNANHTKSATDLVYALHHEGAANLPIPLGVLLMFVMTAVFMGTIISCLEISSERAVYERERMSNLNLVDYVGSKLPFCLSITLIQSLLFLGFCYLFNQNMREIPFFQVWATITAVAWASVSMGLLVSTADPTPGRFSVIMAIVVVLPQLVLSGGLGPNFYKGMGKVSQYIADTLPARWGTEMLFTTIYGNITCKAAAWIPDFVREVIGFQFGFFALYKGFIMLLTICATYLLLCLVLLKIRDGIRCGT